jgi:hypothetical protein
MGVALIWMLLFLLLATGAYGVWHSVVAGEFTARDVHTGRAKYRYPPKWYHRVLHFTVSVTFLVAALATIVHLWKSY